MSESPMLELKEEYTSSTYNFNINLFKYEKNPIVVYRITPHANVSVNNKRLWKAIYKMYEMYEGIGSRIERDGFKFTLREKDLFWFDMIFKQVKGRKTLEFYVATSEFQAQKLKRKIENKMSVTFTEASINDLHIPTENTIVQELRYLRHDIFSLNSNSSEAKTPISSILNTLDELQFDGDMARLSICNEAESRNKWVKSSQWAYEKASQGKIPQRPSMNSKRVVNYLKIGVSAVINELNSFITDILEAFNNSFFKSDKPIEKQKLINKAHSLEDEIGTSRLNREKGNLPVFRSQIRIATYSEDKLTRDSLSETLALSMQDLSDSNELTGIKVTNKGKKMRILNELNSLQLSTTTQYDPNVNLISTDEMSKLALMMPTRELQRKYSDELKVKKHVEVSIPKMLQKEGNLLLGHAELKDNNIPVGLQPINKDEFYTGYTFIGKQGSGKDTAIQNFVYEGATKHNISFIVCDWICESGHRGMADGIRDLLPPDKIIDLDLANEEWIVPMDLTEVINKLGRKGGSRFASEMIDFLQLENMARSQKYLTEASKASNGSLSKMKRIIEDEGCRTDTIERLMNEGNLRLARELSEWGTNDELGNKCDAILSRLNTFFGDDTLFDIFSQPPKQEVNFEQWMREGKTIIIRMPKRKLGNSSRVLAHWVTLKVLLTRMLMDSESKDKHGCFMIFNEPEQVESEGLSNLMGRIATEGRKERLGSIFAFHHWNKLPSHLQTNLLAGGVNQFLFASDHMKTFEMAKDRLYPTFTLEEAISTPKYHSIAILNTREVLPAFMIKMLPPRKERLDNSFLTRRHAQMYGRSWSELQKVL